MLLPTGLLQVLRELGGLMSRVPSAHVEAMFHEVIHAYGLANRRAMLEYALLSHGQFCLRPFHLLKLVPGTCTFFPLLKS